MSDRLDDNQRGSDSPLGLVLVRFGPTEVGEHPVAHVLRDVPLEVDYLARDHSLVSADDLTHLLGIEPPRESGRAHEIDEHHCELAALGLGSRRCCLGIGGARRTGTSIERGLISGVRGCPERRDGLEKLLAVAEEDAELLKVGIGQLRQDVAVDRVLAERLLVLLQLQIAEPCRDVQQHLRQAHKLLVRPMLSPNGADNYRVST